MLKSNCVNEGIAIEGGFPSRSKSNFDSICKSDEAKFGWSYLPKPFCCDLHGILKANTRGTREITLSLAEKVCEKHVDVTPGEKLC